MALSSGTRFGSYEVADEIGAGGMGVVYRATDRNLKRDVAIKVLPESLATDTERLARFQREAELLASLNHPNIAQIYGLENANSTTALVMELVEGPTLADRIEQGAIPADEAIGIAMQIAEALEAAHGRGVVHRDLKPANIKVRPDGTVKVLDFGIAKALEPDTLTGEPSSPSLTTPATQIGVILGTAAYMSPEQARGKTVDQRADVWAFGCLLYEMLTGQPAFGGEDVPITLARVLTDDTDMESLPAAIAPAVRQVIRLCLQKDLRKRVADIRDVRLALEGAFVPDGYPATLVPTGSQSPLRQSLRATAAALIVGGVLVGLVAWSLWPTPASAPVKRFDYDLPEDQLLRTTGRSVFALSPNGRRFIYNTYSGLYLRSMDELEAQLIPGTGPTSTGPVFSPDGQEIAYWEFGAQQVRRLAITGGASTLVADLSINPYGISWEADGTLLIGQPEGIYRVSANGGPLELIISTPEPEIPYGPQLLPGGDAVLFSIKTGTQAWDEARIVVETLSTGARTIVVEGGSDARYLPTGHLVYAAGDALFAVAFDPDSVTVSGGTVPLMQGLSRATANLTAAANYGVSDDDSLVYLRGSPDTQLRTLVWVDREGREEPINVPPQDYTSVRLSPDEMHVVLDTFGAEMDIWTLDLARESEPRKVTRSQTLNSAPVWGANDRLAWSRALTGTMQEVFWQAADGSGNPEPLTANSRIPIQPTDLTADGEWLLYSEFVPPKDIWMIPLDGPPTAGEPLIGTGAEETNATVSPNGQWLAYQSDDQIHVRPFPDVDSSLWQPATVGGTGPVWSADGRELFYYVGEGASGAFMSVSYESEPTFTAGVPEVLFEGPYVRPSGIAAPIDMFYDYSASRQRFLVIKNIEVESEGESDHPQVIIVENWVEELTRLVPTQR